MRAALALSLLSVTSHPCSRSKPIKLSFVKLDFAEIVTLSISGICHFDVLSQGNRYLFHVLPGKFIQHARR